MSEVNFFDRFGLWAFYGSDSALLDQLAITLTNSFVWFPMFIALFILVIRNHDDAKQISLCIFALVVCFALSAGVTNLIVKPLVERPRPCQVLEIRYLQHIPEMYYAKNFSFFSSHSANTMALTMFFYLVVRNNLLTTTLGIWTAINVWTRLYLGQHYLSDIVVGLLWGAFSGWVGYQVYIRVVVKKTHVSQKYTETGFALHEIDIVASMFFITVIYAFLTVA